MCDIQRAGAVSTPRSRVATLGDRSASAVTGSGDGGTGLPSAIALPPRDADCPTQF